MAKDFPHTRPANARKAQPTFDLNNLHIFEIGGSRRRVLRRDYEHVVFCAVDDPLNQVPYDIETLNRMNAAGLLKMIPWGLAPDFASRINADGDEDISLSTLTQDHLQRVETRHAMVCGLMVLKDAGKVKITDESIKAEMLSIRQAAADYLIEDLPDPEKALAVAAWKNGTGPKPKHVMPTPFPDAVSPRTLRGWAKAYQLYGKKGLIDNFSKKGNRNSKLTVEETILLDAVIEREYLTLQRKTITATHAEANKAFKDEGWQPPSRETVRLHIKKIDKFRLLVARFGPDAARNKMRATFRGLETLRPLERVEMDEYKIDLLTLFKRAGLFSHYSEEQLERFGLSKTMMRWWLTVAIDVRTRCILGLVLTPNPKTSSSIKCLHEITTDKSNLAKIVGAKTPWTMFGTPEALYVDNGPAFKSGAFTSACADAGINKIQTIAGAPSMRGFIERFFRTVNQRFLQYLSGRTFGSIEERGDHEAEKRACLNEEQLAAVLVRLIVDVYHNEPHSGLNGRTPLQQWEADIADGNYPLKPAPTLRKKHLAFGLKISRTVEKDGIHAMGLRYNSEELYAHYRANGTETAEVVWFEKDLGQIEVKLKDAWHTIPCVDDTFAGIDATTWYATRKKLRIQDPKRKAWDEAVIADAIESVKKINADAQAFYHVYDHGWSKKRFEAVEAEAGQAFSIVQPRPKTAAAPDGYGQTIAPVPQVQPSLVKDALENSPKNTANSSDESEWLFPE